MNQFSSILLSILFLLIAQWVYGGVGEPKTLEAVRTEVKPTIDGVIDDLFRNSPFKAENFVCLNPTPGIPSAYRTEVFIVYDNQAIFVAAQLYDDNPQEIIKDLSPRDVFSNTDFFGIVLDPYRTGLTGFSFSVSAAGVQRDAKTTSDGDDRSWNDVWQSEVKINKDGWAVEMAIPYSALRFPVEEVSDWNINITRSVRKTREESFWNPIDPELDGYLNQMGTLKNIKNIDSPLRLSLTPYVGATLNTYVNDAGNQDVSTQFAGGVDIKYGINDAFTLDMILIPDFSQVRSDVQVLNLSPFEQRFNENRPFFTEGVELFQTADVFYTRRIGGPGHLIGEVAERSDFDSFVSLPTNNLVNATKVSGRTNNNTGLGFFNAVEVKTHATYIDLDGNTQRTLINPLTNYNVFVVEQALKNNSKIGFVNTNVLRVGEFTDANVTGLDWNLRNNTQNYAFNGKAVASQRFIKDAGIDVGYQLNAAAGKISGEWTYNAGTTIETDNFNPNDLGFLFSPNEMNFFGELNYNKYKPKNDVIATYGFTNSISYESLYAPNEFTGIFTNNRFFLRLKSFNAFGAWLRTAPLGYRDYFEPRTEDFSQYLQRPRSAQVGGFISSDYRKPVAIDIRTNFRKYDLQDKFDFNINVAPRFRLSSQVFIVPSVSYSIQEVDRGFVSPVDFILGQEEVIIGERQVNTFNNGISGQYNLNDKMSLVMQVNHFFSAVEYGNFGTLSANGEVTESNYLGLDNEKNPVHDINFNFFTINTVYTWRFAPGSDLVVSYKSDLLNTTPYAAYLRNVAELSDFYRNGGLNVKALYFLDVNKVGNFFL